MMTWPTLPPLWAEWVAWVAAWASKPGCTSLRKCGIVASAAVPFFIWIRAPGCETTCGRLFSTVAPVGHVRIDVPLGHQIVDEVFLVIQENAVRVGNLDEVVERGRALLFGHGVANIPNRSPDLLLIGAVRSEEHTSELQSRGHLVCRL